MASYLQEKGRPFDVSDIRKPNIYDVIDRMQAEARTSITLEELIDIFSWQHRIYLIKDFMLRRLKGYAQRRWWQERNAALNRGDNVTVSSMDEEFEVKRNLLKTWQGSSPLKPDLCIPKLAENAFVERP